MSKVWLNLFDYIKFYVVVRRKRQICRCKVHLDSQWIQLTTLDESKYSTVHRWLIMLGLINLT